MHTAFRALAVLVLGAAGAGCTSFATVRSAQVQPGGSLTLQGSLSSPPGDEAAWFWSLSCADDCDHPIASVDAAYAYGWAGDQPFTLGAGVNGFFPYVEGYAQLSGDSARAFGVGGRLGIPATGWSNHQLYGRLDLPLAGGRRVLWNPGVFLHAGRSPNGLSRGHFVAMVQAVGLEHRGPRRTIVPALALVVGRGRRDRDREDEGSFTTVFGAATVSVTFHRRRTAPPAPQALAVPAAWSAEPADEAAARTPAAEGAATQP
jgi:hypothetical protein